MTTLHCLHGSSATPENPEDFIFQLYDYTYFSDTQKTDHPHVNSGLDAEGPGIYAFAQKDDAPFEDFQLSGAQSYSGKNGQGSVLGFSVPLGDAPLANESPADAIPIEEWADVVDRMVDRVRERYQYNRHHAESLAEEIHVNWDETSQPPSPSDIESLLKVVGKDADHAMVVPDNVSPDEWFDNVINELELADPADFILQEGDPWSVAEMAIDNADNLWETLKNVFHYAAVDNRGNSYRSFNAAFLEAVNACVSQPELVRAASVNDGRFAVIFDTTSIQMEYAKVYTHDIDPDKLQALITDIGDVQATYWGQLEPHQLAMKLNEVARNHFGCAFSDDLTQKLRMLRGPDSFYSHLIEEIRDEVSTRQEREWVLSDETRQRFTYTPNHEEPDPAQVLRRAL